MNPLINNGDEGGVKISETDFEKWKEIAEKIKNVRRELYELSDELETVPKNVYNDEYHQVSKHLRGLKSKLEDRMFEEHPDEADENIFYGASEGSETSHEKTKKTEARETEDVSRSEEKKPHFCKSCGKVIPSDADYCKICAEEV